MSGIPSWAVRWAKVVCVSIRPAESYPEVAYPTIGETYTIGRVGIGEDTLEAIITVDEIDSRDREGCDIGFELSCFRPAVEPKSEAEDLAHFRHHLDQRQPVDA